MIEILVFDVGHGAATLLLLPPSSDGTVRVGIVDCFAGAGARHPLLRFLQDLDDRSGGKVVIEFLVLTHLHFDHFWGVGALLKRFGTRIRRVADSGLDPREVIFADFPGRLPLESSARRELEAWRRFKKRKHVVVGALTTPNVEVYADRSADVAVRTVAPDGRMLEQVKAEIQRKVRLIIDALLRGVVPPGRQVFDLNRTSSALTVCIGETSALIGGDVLCAAWDQVLRDTHCKVDVFVLSHHGSSTGFPEKHWKEKIQKPIAHAIVSGKGQSQPSGAVVEFLKREQVRVWSTAESERLSDSATVSYALAANLRARLARRPSGSIRITLRGHAVEVARA